MIALEQVHVVRSGRTLVHDVTCTPAQGRLTVVLGANGAGKTSLFRLMCGEWEPTSGRVLWEGTPIKNHPRGKLSRKRALVAQHIPVTFPFRAHELALLGRLPHNRYPTREDLEIVDAALAEAEALDFADRRIDTLSGGERQRVHMARALAQLHEARKAGSGILLLDEPTAHLDLAHQQQMLLMARKLAGDGLAVVAVLHDVNLAAAHADDAMLIHRGRLLASGNAAQVLQTGLLSTALNINLQPVPLPDGKRIFMPTSDHTFKPQGVLT